ncbi:MAG TPA: hydroxyethylthiazole kinase [Euzebyales bacterium]|nr:hydroxyethylthiazole kinase [Euzebyales bacterium]
MVTVDTVWADVQQVRDRGPLVHNITNYVVMNTTANALLAIGAAPVMAHAVQEVADMTALAGALVINIGTLSEAWIEAMVLAMRSAGERGIPIVVDPVGAGATTYRTRTVHELISATAPTIIRGNASEIMAVAAAGDGGRTQGVDSADASEAALDAARDLHARYGAVVAITGEADYVVGTDVLRITGGHPLMARVTGTGCTASALCAAFAAVNRSPFAATVHALAALGAAGAAAGRRARGPGTMQLHLYDELHTLEREQVVRHVGVAAA